MLTANRFPAMACHPIYNGSRPPTLIGGAPAYVEDNLRWRPAGGMDADAVTEIDLNSAYNRRYSSSSCYCMVIFRVRVLSCDEPIQSELII